MLSTEKIREIGFEAIRKLKRLSVSIAAECLRDAVLFDRLIAECAFENEVFDNSISEVMDWNRCVEFQRGYMHSQ